ncbi:MAG TPA: NUDIX hydrolase [Desulfosalsimonadaceae bacterium]|nr:NUDIX hydrolase [Desulfosalsimonadaceae bacterium]
MQTKTPLLTVDTIIAVKEKIVLIERKNPPYGWALPGGFADYGESLEAAAKREAKEETSLEIQLIEQFHTYSAPDRDPRHHTVSTVFLARAEGPARAADDAANAGLFDRQSLPETMAFDHRTILTDYFRYMEGTARSIIFSDRL